MGRRRRRKKRWRGAVEEWRTLSGAARGKDTARTADILPGAAEELVVVGAGGIRES